MTLRLTQNRGKWRLYLNGLHIFASEVLTEGISKLEAVALERHLELCEVRLVGRAQP